MILTGSRYAGQPVITVPADEMGRGTIAVFRLIGHGSSTFTYYIVKEGDRFDSIAYQALGRPDLWWMIADANPEVFYPDSLVAGSVIRIPS